MTDNEFDRLHAAGEKVMLWIGIISTALVLIAFILTVLAFTRPAFGATVSVGHVVTADKGVEMLYTFVVGVALLSVAVAVAVVFAVNHKKHMERDDIGTPIFLIAAFTILFCAGVLFLASTRPASSATIPRTEPIPVYHGLLMYPDHIEGRHAFGPADGIDFWLGKGKGDHLTASVPRMAHKRAYRRGGSHVYDNSRTHSTRQFWSHGSGLVGWGSDCGCEENHIVTPEPSPVPLPSAALLLLSALGLVAIRRSRG